jgi:tetratricopeptide (TPR) repeat protein
MTKLHLAIVLGCLVSLSVSTSQITQAQQEPGRMSIHPVRIELHGIVRFGDIRRPAANILVRLENSNGGVAAQMLTDRDGRFLFSGLASRQYTLTVHAQGYRDSYQTVEFLTQTSDYVNIDLAPDVIMAPKPRKTIAYIDASVPAAARKEYEKGEEALAERKTQDAAQHFQNAVQLHPTFFEAELSLGTAYMDLGQWDKAEASLGRATELNPKSPNAFFALGEVYLHGERLAEAEKTLRSGLSLENRSWKAHFALARVYWKKSDISNTGKQLALTLQLNPNSAEAHFMAGDVFMRAGKLPEALAEFQEYLRLDPKGANVAQAKEVIQRLEKRVTTLNK